MVIPRNLKSAVPVTLRSTMPLAAITEIAEDSSLPNLKSCVIGKGLVSPGLNGIKSTGIVATTAFIVPSMTETVLETVLAT
jgi:hypothetical protein